MDEFAHKKLGEVLAFCKSYEYLNERSRQTLVKIFGGKWQEKILNQTASFKKRIEEIVTTKKGKEIVNTKANKTFEKLNNLAQMYIGDSWDDPAELMEWLGFFEGAAIIHWRLVEGVAQKYESVHLSLLSKEALKLHSEVFSLLELKIFEYSKDR